MSHFQLAGAAEILRSSQKDEEYLRYMRNLFSDLIQRTQGIPCWLKWKDVCNLVSDLMFFSFTTLSGYQTLGEEYVNIVQVDKSLKKVPSLMKRFLDVLLQTVGYYFFLHLQQRLESRTHLFPQNSPHFRDSHREKFMKYLPLFIKILLYVQQLHLILFYISGSFHHVSKRLTSVKYVVIRRWLSDERFQNPFRWLGGVAAFQMASTALWMLYDTLGAKDNKSEGPVVKAGGSTEVAVAEMDQCCLCLGRRSQPTLTPCGHAFCWHCITQWMRNKEECPLCREAFAPSRLVYLQNYD